MSSTKFRLIDPWLPCPHVLPQEVLPLEMQQLVEGVAHCEEQEAALQLAYEKLTEKYQGYRILTFLRIDRFLVRSVEKLWSFHGFLHCHHMNYLLRTVLVASGKFERKDIEAHWTQIWLFSPHQYLTVELADGRKIEVDLWGKANGIGYGAHAHGLQDFPWKWWVGVVLLATFLLFSPLGTNLWLMLTGNGYGIPVESSVFTFQPTVMNEGSGDWWLCGEDSKNFYVVNSAESGYQVRSRSAEVNWCLWE